MKDLRDIIRAGGYIEGDNTGNKIDDLVIFTSDTGEKTLYPNADAAPRGGGASIVMNNETGDITVTVPEKWQNDERVKQFTDNNNLKYISGNYKNNKDATYQDPFDETKQIKADEWIKQMDEALKSRIEVLNVQAPVTADVIQMYGGDEAKNEAIKKLTAEDIVVMSSNFNRDDSWIPLPKYMLMAYPELEKMLTFKKSGDYAFVQKIDFLNNFYNIEDGKITEANAYGIATAPKKVLGDVQDLDSADIASTIAFGNFIKSVDPKRSNWSQFWKAGDALSTGFYGGFYDWWVGTSDLLVNAANFSWANGNTVDTRDFWNGFFKIDLSQYAKDSANMYGATNSEYASKVATGYVGGALAGKAVDAVVSMIAIGEATSLIADKVTSKIVDSGAKGVAKKMNDSAAFKLTTEKLANGGGTITRQVEGVNSATGVVTDAMSREMLAADAKALAKGLSSGWNSNRYRAFFGQTLTQAYEMYEKAVAGADVMLKNMSMGQLANIVNSATKVAQTATLANTAIDVLGSIVISAIIGDKELATKVISGKGTSDDAKTLLLDSALLTAKGYAFLGLTKVAGVGRDWVFERFPKFGEAVNKFSDAASQKIIKLDETLSHPWNKFMKWYLDRKTAIARAHNRVIPNRQVAATEAVKENILREEAKAYGANLSREAGSNGTKIINEAFREKFGSDLIASDPNAATNLTQDQMKAMLAEVGITFSEKELAQSEFKAWKADYVRLDNALTAWNSIEDNVSYVVKSFTNPDIEPVISGQIKTMNEANSKLLEAEGRAGLLSKIEEKTNKRLEKNEKDASAIYSYHSEEAAIYAVRSYELGIIRNEAILKGEDPSQYKPFIEALARAVEASKNIPEDVRNIIDQEYLPALRDLDREIVNKMVDDGVFPRSYVEGMRAGGKYGEDGKSWLRLVARKDLPKGVYNPFSKLVKQDNTIQLFSFKVLDDGDITWVGNGVSELITEYAMAKSEKELLEAATKATGLTTETIISGNQTGAVGKLEEYDSDLKSAINQGVKSFVESSSGTVSIGKKRARQQSEFYKEVTITGGIASMDIGTLRTVLQENGVPLSTDITDQESLEKFYDESNDYVKKLIDQAIGSRGTNFTEDVITPANMFAEHKFDRLVEDRANIRREIELKKRTVENLQKDLYSGGNAYAKTVKLKANLDPRYVGSTAEEEIWNANQAELERIWSTYSNEKYGENGVEKWIKDTPYGQDAFDFMRSIGDNGSSEAYGKIREKYSKELIPSAEDFVDTERFDVVNVGENQMSPEYVARETARLNSEIANLEKVAEHYDNMLLSENYWPDFWKKASKNVKEVIKKQLKDTSLQTGYGIKGQELERLSAMVPGFNVLDWSLLNREQTNGLINGGLYKDIDNDYESGMFIFDIDDFARIAGIDTSGIVLNENTKYSPDHNTLDGEAVIPMELNDKGELVLGGRLVSTNAFGWNKQKLAEYIASLKQNGVTKIPVAISRELQRLEQQLINIKSRATQEQFDEYMEKRDALIKNGESGVKKFGKKLEAYYKSRTGNRTKDDYSDFAMSVWREMANKKSSISKDEKDAAVNYLAYKYISEGRFRSTFVDKIQNAALLKRVKAFLKLEDTIESQDAFEIPRENFIIEDLNNLGSNASEVTGLVQQAFSKNARIPFFHGQRSPYGSMEFNNKSMIPKGDDVYTANNGIGDAYWLSPNADYTSPYGGTQLAGNIPTKYFLSDKEMNSALEKASNRLAELTEKGIELAKKKIKLKDPEEKILVDLNSSNSVTPKELEKAGLVRVKDSKKLAKDNAGNIYELAGAVKVKVNGVNIKKALFKPTGEREELNIGIYEELGPSLLSKKERAEYRLLEKINPDRKWGGNISYRALAEYTKKPVIDISIPMQSMPGVRADGTAFFYYKGVSPKFDEEISKQLETQKSGIRVIKDDIDSLTKYLKSYEGMSLDELLEDLYPSVGLDDSASTYWDNLLWRHTKGKKTTKDELDSAFKELIQDIGTLSQGTAKVLETVWDVNRHSADLAKLKINSKVISKLIEEAKSGQSVKNDIVDFVNLLNQKFDYVEPTEEGVAEWNAVNPRVYNVSDSPVFKAPKGDISYEDFKASMGIGGLEARAELFRAIDDQRYINFTEMQGRDTDKFNALLDKIDRANAANNDSVRGSVPVRTAAVEFSKTVRELDNTIVLANNLSYLRKTIAAKGSLQEFADNNGIAVTGNGKNIKKDVKEALWNMLLNGEKIPEIQGLHVKNIEKEVANFKASSYETPNPKVKEVESLENMIADAEKDLNENLLPQTDAIKTISNLDYNTRKKLAEYVVRGNNDYMLLYRMQEGKPDQWRANDRGKDGKFEPLGGEPGLQGAVWLTADKDWVEGPERASAGVGDNVTDENIVVIPVKKSDILNLNHETLAKDELDKTDKKIVKTRGIDKGLKKSEYILWENEHPEIFSDGMGLMLEEYNKAFESSYYKKKVEAKKNDIDVMREELERLKNESTADGGVELSISPEEINKDLLEDLQKRFYEALDKTKLFQEPSGPNVHKYEVDEKMLSEDLDEAIDDMIDRVGMSPRANLALEGLSEFHGEKLTPTRREFYILGSLLAEKNAKDLDELLSNVADKIVGELVPENSLIIPGNIKSVKETIEKIVKDKLEGRLAIARASLATMGENVDSSTVTELLEKYMKDLGIATSDPLVVKTTDANGEIIYIRVSPTIAGIYNERPVYTPMGTPMKLWTDLALLKKIFTVDLSAKSFTKQAVSDPVMAFATIGVLPGTMQALNSELKATFGDILKYMPTSDPKRYANIQKIAEREGISMEEALLRNINAIAEVEIPFSLLNSELLRQSNTAKYGNKVSLQMMRRHWTQKINDGLRTVSNKLGFMQNKRETYPRTEAGVKARFDAIKDGYSLEQAEEFGIHAINNATTNFRQKHAVLNGIRSTVPFSTSGISGAKSFWKMFELDPVGVTSRIFSGFIVPIMYFVGEIMSDEELRKKYEALAESEKNNHIAIAVGGEIILIPVGEELGQYTNIVTHLVENMYHANKYDFYNLMLNDIVNLLPAGDLTGFTDPEMWQPISGQAPSFLEVLSNGTSKMFASTMPPVLQTSYMLLTGRDLYTGKKINTGYTTIDDEGNAVVMTYSTSQFAKWLSKVVGGDARVIEKVVTGISGTVAGKLLDVITSAVQFISSGGKEGSLTTAVEKAVEDMSKPFMAYGYDSLEKRFNSRVSELFDKKESIENNDAYKAYNTEISKDANAETRQKKIAKRNDMFHELQNDVKALVEGYRNAGGTLDKWKLATVTSLLTFEDAVRADRTFMHLNTEYSNAYKQAMQTLYDMGITDPDGPSALGYVYTDKQGNPQVVMWNPVQIQIIQNAMKEQGNIYAAHIKAIVNDGTENSLYNQYKQMVADEQPYFDKYHSTGKLSDAEWDKIDDMRKEFNEKLAIGLTNYMNSYGAANILSNDEVINYFKSIVQIPSSYETVKGRYISSGNGKVDKEGAFIESYLKQIFGVANYGK